MSRRTQATRTTKSGTLESSPSAQATTATNAPTPEDLALDRALQQAAAETPAEFSEGASENRVRMVKEGERVPLSEFVDDYRPAATVEQLDMQIHQVAPLGADSVEATDAVFARLLGPAKTDESFMYKNVMVYRVGKRDSVIAKNGLDMETKVFKRA